jgi:hypothetical protein
MSNRRSSSGGPLSRAYRPFLGPIFTVRSGSIWSVRQAVEQFPLFAHSFRREPTGNRSVGLELPVPQVLNEWPLFAQTDDAEASKALRPTRADHVIG